MEVSILYDMLIYCSIYYNNSTTVLHFIVKV